MHHASSYKPQGMNPGMDLGLAGAFILLLCLNTWHHIPWSDELHAWGLMRASTDPWTLFDNLHFEGHPGLWHVLLFAASLVAPTPVAMKVLHLLLAASMILLIARFAPFRTIEKAFLFANYFLVYEYAVLARNYGLGLLLALLHAMLRCAATPRPVLVGLVLGLMGNANVYAFVLSGLLVLEYGYSGLIASRRLLAAGLARIVAGVALYGALMLLALASFWPDPAVAHFVQQPSAFEMHDPVRFGVQFLRALVPPFLPVDFSFPHSFAFAGNLFDYGKRVWFCLALAPFILFALWRIFRTRIDLLAVILAVMTVAAIFSFLVYPAAIRHLGIVFIAFVAMLWVAKAEAKVMPDPRAVLFLLGLGAIGGGFAQAGQWMRPFAINDQAVAWLRANDLADAPLLGYPDMRVEPIGILLNRPFYALDCECEARYVRLDNRRDSFIIESVPARLDRAARRYGPGPIVLIAGDPLDEPLREEIRAMGYTLVERVHLDGAERDIALTILTVSRAPEEGTTR